MARDVTALEPEQRRWFRYPSSSSPLGRLRSSPPTWSTATSAPPPRRRSALTDKALAERNRARANLTHFLHWACRSLETARNISTEFGLGLEVPQEISRAIRDVIEEAARAHQQENPPI
jgi:hypothetical protein